MDAPEPAGDGAVVQDRHLGEDGGRLFLKGLSPRGDEPLREENGQEAGIGYEEDVIFTEKDGCRFIDGRQTKLLLIK